MGLLSEVRKLILEEPRRYNQGDWLSRISEHADWIGRDKFPACGTIGCVAGWVATLRAPPNFNWLASGSIARGILGIDEAQGNALFGGEAAGENPQTPEHARRGAKHIAAFMQQHARQLKATKLR